MAIGLFLQHRPGHSVVGKNNQVITKQQQLLVFVWSIAMYVQLKPESTPMNDDT